MTKGGEEGKKRRKTSHGRARGNFLITWREPERKEGLLSTEDKTNVCSPRIQLALSTDAQGI